MNRFDEGGYIAGVPASATKQDLARGVWRAMFDLLMVSAAERQKSIARRGLTPNDSRALHSLDREGRPMRALAEAWKCDASNATWIVDRLEKLGFAERRSVPADRRVKLVVLTPKGERVKQELQDEFYTPPAELLALDRETLEVLHGALAKLTAVRGAAPKPALASRPLPR